MAKTKIDGLSFKKGPTQSGVPPVPTPSFPVGGEVVGIDVVSVFLRAYWPILVILLIPLLFALYKKRAVLPKWFLRLMYFLRG